LATRTNVILGQAPLFPSELDQPLQKREAIVDHGSNPLGSEPVSDNFGPTDRPIVNTSDSQSAARTEVQAGLRHLYDGDYEKAIGPFTAALRIEPSSRTFTLRADAYQSLGNLDRAIADFTAAIRLDPSNTAAYVGRGKVHQQTGDPTKAVADCTAALRLDPENWAAYSGRAGAYTDLADVERAVADYSEVLEHNRRDFFALFNRGKAFATQGKFDAAIADFTLALEANPNYVPGYLHRGHAYKSKGDYWQAVSDYTEILAHSQNPTAYTCRAQTFQIIGDFSRAVDDFAEAIRLDPNNSKAFCGRGVVHRLNGDLHEALADLDEAVRLNPNDAPPYFHRGMIGLAVNQLAPAIDQFSVAISLAPDFATAYLNRALAHERMENMREAVSDCTKALELNPELPAAYLIRGTAFLNAQRFDAAVTDLSRALELDPGFAMAYRRRARAFTHCKMNERALADYSRLLKLEPEDALAYANRGIVHRLMGNHDEALADLDLAMRLDPKSILVGFDRGLGEIDMRQSVGAVMEYTEGRRSPPVIVQQEKIEQPPTPVAVAASVESRVAIRPSRPAKRMPVKANPPPVISKSQAPTVEMRSEQSAEETAADLLLGEEVPDETALTMEAPTRAVEPAVRTVRCPMCQAVAPPAEVIPGPRERVKCAKCNAVFMPLPTAPEIPEATVRPALTSPTRPLPPSPAKSQTLAKPKKHAAASGDSGEITRRRWLWRGPMIGGATTAAIFVLIMFSGLFASGRSVKVYPAKGGVTFDGNPIPQALVTLHPADMGNPNYPLPRGTVQEDGSFVLGTFTKTDGVPAGSYIVTVLWLEAPVAVGPDDDDMIPENKLPAKYGNPRTSEFKVEIREGQNILPPIQLKADPIASGGAGSSRGPSNGRPKQVLNDFPE